MQVLRNADFFDESGIHWHFARGNEIFEHQHEFFEIFVVTEGKLTHVVNGKEQKLSVGDCVFIKPYDCHKARRQTDLFTIVNIAFTKEMFCALSTFVSPKIFEDILNESMPACIKVKPGLLSKLSAYYFSLIQRKQLLFDLFCEFANAAGQIQTSFSERIVELMSRKENLFEGISRLFELSGKSREHTCRLIKKELGITPAILINNLRLSCSADLLLHTDIKIIDIALDIGYENLGYFYRMFKNKYGMSPGEYRKQYQKRMI